MTHLNGVVMYFVFDLFPQTQFLIRRDEINPNTKNNMYHYRSMQLIQFGQEL